MHAYCQADHVFEIVCKISAEATTAEAREAVVTALPCLAGAFSFYEPSGAVDGELRFPSASSTHGTQRKSNTLATTAS